MIIQRKGELKVPCTKSGLKLGKIYQIALRGHKYLVRLDNNQAFSLKGYESTDRFYEVNHTLVIED